MIDKIKMNEFLQQVTYVSKGKYNLDIAHDLLVLFFLKFVSDNQDALQLSLSNLRDFNEIARSYRQEGNQQALVELCLAVECQLNIEQYGVANHLTRLLGRIVDLDYLSELLFRFTEVDFSDAAEECVIASSLLDCLASKSGNGLTPSVSLGSISYLMTQIGDVECRHLFWDGYCGYGRNLLEVAKQNPHITIYANEINSHAAMSAAMLLIMGFHTHYTIQSVDSMLTSASDLRNRVDLIISTPPFGTSLSQGDLTEICQNDDIPYPELLSKRGDLFFLQQAIAKLAPNGVAVIQLPMGGLFQSGKVKELRKALVVNGHIKAVIQLPSGCAVGTAIPTCLFVVTPAKVNSEVVLINTCSKQFAVNFTRVGRSSMELSTDGAHEIKSLIDSKNQLEGVSVCVTLQEIAEMDYLLTPDAYTTQKVEIQKLYIPLKELIETEHLLLQAFNLLAKQNNQGGQIYDEL